MMKLAGYYVFIFRVQFFIFSRIALSQQDDSDATPANDECVDAIPISINATGFALSSTIVGGATNVFNLDFEHCGGDTFDVGSPGVWFAITEPGTAGSRWKASTCSDRTSNSFPRVTIYKGADCDSMTCIESSVENDPECPYPDSSFVEWVTGAGEQYFLLVHDDAITSEESADFVLRLTDVTDPPSNSACENATALTLEEDPTGLNPPVGNVSGSIFGSTAQATSVPLECTSNSGDSGLDESNIAQSLSRESLPNGVWYKITPSSSSEDTDGYLDLFLCSSPVGLDVAVFDGIPCDDDVVNETLLCQETKPVGANHTNFSCSNENEIPTNTSWNVTAGREYYVLIYGVDYAHFGLTLLRQGYNRNSDYGAQSGTKKESMQFCYDQWFCLLVVLATIYQLIP
jgi:hypothetical protein